MKYDLSQLKDRKSFVDYSAKLIESGAKVEFKKLSKPRTGQQNKYLHVLISLVAIEQGYTIDEMKIVLKELGGFTYVKNDRLFPEPSALMDTKRLGEFIDFVFDFGKQLGLTMPTPEDFNNYWFSIEQQIEKGKIY